MHRRTEEQVAGTARQPSESVEPKDLAQLTHELGIQNEELRQAQAELKLSHDRYLDLYNRAPLAYVTLDLNGTIVEANHVAAALLGAPHACLLGQPLAQYVRVGDSALFKAYLNAIALGEEPGTLELRLALANGGRPQWVALESSLVTVGPHRQSQCRIALLDISERVKMQEGLARLAAIVASSDEAIISRDLEGRVDSWNEAAHHLFGYEAEELLGQTMDELVPEELRAQEADLLFRLRGGEKVAHLESERVARDGKRIPVSMSLSPIRDEHGLVVGSALMARDISERRRADRALRERVRQLDVLSQAGQALILGEQEPATMREELLERVRVAVGSEICLNYGVSDDGKSMVLLSSVGLSDQERSDMAQVPVDDSPCGLAVKRRSRVVIDDLQNSSLPRSRLLKRTGARCYVGCPLVAHGHVYGVAAFVSTSRERFRSGDLLVIKTLCDQVAAMLERSQLIAELRDSDQTQRQAARAKDDMIATLAHELRNPLAPIRNAVSILHRDDLSNPSRIAWCRDIIERQVVQMTHLLEDLLDASRLTRNKIELRLEHIELTRAIGQAIEATHPLIDSRRQRLQLTLPDEPIMVQGDLTRLTQVFGNLLSNAAKYSDPGSDIVLRAWRDGDMACVSVRDNGIGIAAEQLPLVFRMFSQLLPALERSDGGLGIGLALARGLVEQHHGTLTAESDGPGQGSEFTVRLPIGEPNTSHPAVGHGEAAAVPRRRLLVVDDNVDAAQTLAAMLELYGQEVRTAFNGIDALRVAAQWPPDVAVLDIGMPDLNGYELCERLRQQSHGRPPLFIACTGWGQEADRERAHEAGFDFHLVKPIELNALLRLLGISPMTQHTDRAGAEH